MLKSLYIKDYAIIEHIEVEFNKGLNIITGETGAGKTILIDAMNLLLGERASTEAVRKGSEKAVVEGIFNVKKNKKVEQILNQNEIEFHSELIVRREISLKGTNRCFINDTPGSLSVIKELGDILVDLHGQHEHQSLLKTETHIDYLDNCSDIEDLLRTYRWNYNNLIKLGSELNSLKKKENLLKEQKNLFEFQIKEIDAVSPEENEEEKLSNELNLLENSEKLLELTTQIYSRMYESENSVYDLLMQIKNEFNELSRIDKSFSESGAELDSVTYVINEISNQLRSYINRIDIDPETLEKIRARLGAISLLKKKYGGSVKTVLEHREKIGDEFNLIENYAEKISELQSKIKAVKENCASIALNISRKRKAAAGKVEKEIIELLKHLGIPDAKFEIRILQKPASGTDDFILVNGKPYKFNSTGYDEVEFYISTNKGEDTKPLAKIASGGEISRIMLALKSVLAQNDKLPLLIFDEIDTGVSGSIAQKVGIAIKSLASYHQIIAITHLPQITALADHHFIVEKIISDGRVISKIKILDREGRVLEVARLLSGENITEASLKSARELMSIK
jgi:DNA repair protein RecN (Recombination protein N)